MSTKPTVVTARTKFTRNYYDIQEDTDAAKRILRDPLQMSWFEKAQRKPGQKTEFWLNTWTCPYCGTEHPEYRKGWKVSLHRKHLVTTIGLEMLPLFLLNILCLGGTLLSVWKKDCYQQLR